MAAEMSNLTKDQIMLQASTAMIAQANQVPETVLGLIQNRG
jgi:flagellin